MQLNTPAMAIAFGILWGTCLLFVGVANMIWPGYGQALLPALRLNLSRLPPRHRLGLSGYWDDLRIG